jgi:hypothetical protein
MAGAILDHETATRLCAEPTGGIEEGVGCGLPPRDHRRVEQVLAKTRQETRQLTFSAELRDTVRCDANWHRERIECLSHENRLFHDGADAQLRRPPSFSEPSTYSTGYFRKNARGSGC